MLRSEDELKKPSFSRLKTQDSIGRISKKHSARRKELLRFVNNLEYNSYISVAIAEKLTREINGIASYNEQTPEYVDEIRKKLFLLHDYNSHVAKVAYTYPISKETYELLGRYVALESDVLYKNKRPSKYEKQVEDRVFRTIVTFLNNSFSTEEKSLSDQRNTLYNEALKVFVRYVDVKYTSDEEKFPARIVKNILNTLGLIKKSPTDASAHLDLDNPVLIRLKESLKDSDYGSDDDGQETASVSSESSFRTRRNNEVKTETSTDAIITLDSSSDLPATTSEPQVTQPSTISAPRLEPIVSENEIEKSSQSSLPENSGLESLSDYSDSQPVPNFPTSSEVFSSVSKNNVVGVVELNVDDDIESIRWMQRKSQIPHPHLDKKILPGNLSNKLSSHRKKKNEVKKEVDYKIFDTISIVSSEDEEADFECCHTNFDAIEEKLREQRRRRELLGGLIPQKIILDNTQNWTESTTSFNCERLSSGLKSEITDESAESESQKSHETCKSTWLNTNENNKEKFPNSEIIIDLSSLDEDESDGENDKVSLQNRISSETWAAPKIGTIPVKPAQISNNSEKPKATNEIIQICDEYEKKEPPSIRGKIFCRSIDQLTDIANEPCEKKFTITKSRESLDSVVELDIQVDTPLVNPKSVDSSLEKTLVKNTSGERQRESDCSDSVINISISDSDDEVIPKMGDEAERLQSEKNIMDCSGVCSNSAELSSFSGCRSSEKDVEQISYLDAVSSKQNISINNSNCGVQPRDALSVDLSLEEILIRNTSAEKGKESDYTILNISSIDSDIEIISEDCDSTVQVQSDNKNANKSPDALKGASKRTESSNKESPLSEPSEQTEKLINVQDVKKFGFSNSISSESISTGGNSNCKVPVMKDILQANALEKSANKDSKEQYSDAQSSLDATVPESNFDCGATITNNIDNMLQKFTNGDKARKENFDRTLSKIVTSTCSGKNDIIEIIDLDEYECSLDAPCPDFESVQVKTEVLVDESNTSKDGPVSPKKDHESSSSEKEIETSENRPEIISSTCSFHGTDNASCVQYDISKRDEQVEEILRSEKIHDDEQVEEILRSQITRKVDHVRVNIVEEDNSKDKQAHSTSSESKASENEGKNILDNSSPDETEISTNSSSIDDQESSIMNIQKNEHMTSEETAFFTNEDKVVQIAKDQKDTNTDESELQTFSNSLTVENEEIIISTETSSLVENTETPSNVNEENIIETSKCQEQENAEEDETISHMNEHTASTVEIVIENEDVKELEKTEPKLFTASVSYSKEEILELTHSESFSSCFTHEKDQIIESEFVIDTTETEEEDSSKELEISETIQQSIEKNSADQEVVSSTPKDSEKTEDKIEVFEDNQHFQPSSGIENMEQQDEFLESDLCICSEQEIETNHSDISIPPANEEEIVLNSGTGASKYEEENTPIIECSDILTVEDEKQSTEIFGSNENVKEQEENLNYQVCTSGATEMNIATFVAGDEMKTDSLENQTVDKPIKMLQVDEELEILPDDSTNIHQTSEETETNLLIIEEGEKESSPHDSSEKSIVVDENAINKEKENEEQQQTTNEFTETWVSDIAEEYAEKKICNVVSSIQITNSIKNKASSETILYDDECSTSYIIDEGVEVGCQNREKNTFSEKDSSRTSVTDGSVASAEISVPNKFTDIITLHSTTEECEVIVSNQEISVIETEIPFKIEGDGISESALETVSENKQLDSDSLRAVTSPNSDCLTPVTDEDPSRAVNKIVRLDITPKRSKSKSSESHNVVGNLGKMMLLMSNTEPRRPKRSILFTSPIKKVDTCPKFDTSPTTSSTTVVDIGTRDSTYSPSTTDSGNNSALITTQSSSFNESNVFPPSTFYSSYVSKDTEVFYNIPECESQQQQLDIDILASVASNQIPLKVDTRQQKSSVGNAAKSPRNRKSLKIKIAENNPTSYSQKKESTGNTPSIECRFDTNLLFDDSKLSTSTPKNKSKVPKSNLKSPKPDRKKDSNSTKTTSKKARGNTKNNVEQKTLEKISKEESKINKKIDKRKSNTSAKDKKTRKVVKTPEKICRIDQAFSSDEELVIDNSDSEDSLPLNIRMKKCEVLPADNTDNIKSNKKESFPKNSTKTKVSRGRGKSKEKKSNTKQAKTIDIKKLDITCIKEMEVKTNTEAISDKSEKIEPKVVTSPDQTRRIVHFKKAILELISQDLDENNSKNSNINESDELPKPIVPNDNDKIEQKDISSETNVNQLNKEFSSSSLSLDNSEHKQKTVINVNSINSSSERKLEDLDIPEPNVPNSLGDGKPQSCPEEKYDDVGINNLNIYISPLSNNESEAQRNNDKTIETSLQELEKVIEQVPESTSSLKSDSIQSESRNINVSKDVKSLKVEDDLLVSNEEPKINTESVVRKHRKKELLESQRCIEELENIKPNEPLRELTQDSTLLIQSQMPDANQEKPDDLKCLSSNFEEKFKLEETLESNEQIIEHAEPLDSPDEKVGQTEAKGNDHGKKRKKLPEWHISSEFKVSLTIPDIDSVLKNKFKLTNKVDNISQRSLRSNTNTVHRSLAYKSRVTSKYSSKEEKNATVQENILNDTEVYKGEHNSVVDSINMTLVSPTEETTIQENIVNDTEANEEHNSVVDSINMTSVSPTEETTVQENILNDTEVYKGEHNSVVDSINMTLVSPTEETTIQENIVNDTEANEEHNSVVDSINMTLVSPTEETTVQENIVNDTEANEEHNSVVDSINMTLVSPTEETTVQENIVNDTEANKGEHNSVVDSINITLVSPTEETTVQENIVNDTEANKGEHNSVVDSMNISLVSSTEEIKNNIVDVIVSDMGKHSSTINSNETSIPSTKEIKDNIVNEIESDMGKQSSTIHSNEKSIFSTKKIEDNIAPEPSSEYSEVKLKHILGKNEKDPSSCKIIVKESTKKRSRRTRTLYDTKQDSSKIEYPLKEKHTSNRSKEKIMNICKEVNDIGTNEVSKLEEKRSEIKCHQISKKIYEKITANPFILLEKLSAHDLDIWKRIKDKPRRSKRKRLDSEKSEKPIQVKKEIEYESQDPLTYNKKNNSIETNSDASVNVVKEELVNSERYQRKTRSRKNRESNEDIMPTPTIENNTIDSISNLVISEEQTEKVPSKTVEKTEQENYAIRTENKEKLIEESVEDNQTETNLNSDSGEKELDSKTINNTATELTVVFAEPNSKQNLNEKEIESSHTFEPEQIQEVVIETEIIEFQDDADATNVVEEIIEHSIEIEVASDHKELEESKDTRVLEEVVPNEENKEVLISVKRSEDYVYIEKENKIIMDETVTLLSEPFPFHKVQNPSLPTDEIKLEFAKEDEDIGEKLKDEDKPISEKSESCEIFVSDLPEIEKNNEHTLGTDEKSIDRYTGINQNSEVEPENINEIESTRVLKEDTKYTEDEIIVEISEHVENIKEQEASLCNEETSADLEVDVTMNKKTEISLKAELQAVTDETVKPDNIFVENQINVESEVDDNNGDLISSDKTEIEEPVPESTFDNVTISLTEEKTDDTSPTKCMHEPPIAVELAIDIKSPKNKRKRPEEQEEIEKFIAPKKCNIQIIQNEIVRPALSEVFQTEEVLDEIEKFDKIKQEICEEISEEQVLNESKTIEENDNETDSSQIPSEELVECHEKSQISAETIIRSSECEEIVHYNESPTNDVQLETVPIGTIDVPTELNKNEFMEASEIIEKMQTSDEPYCLDTGNESGTLNDDGSHSNDIKETCLGSNDNSEGTEYSEERLEVPEHALNLSVHKYEELNTSEKKISIQDQPMDLPKPTNQTRQDKSECQVQNPSRSELSFSIERMLNVPSNTQLNKVNDLLQNEFSPETSKSTENTTEEKANDLSTTTRETTGIFKHPGKLHKDKLDTKKKKSNSISENEEIKRINKKEKTTKKEKPCKVIVEKVYQLDELVVGEPISPCMNYFNAPIIPISTELIPYRIGVYGTVVPTAETIIMNNTQSNLASLLSNNSHQVSEVLPENTNFRTELDTRGKHEEENVASTSEETVKYTNEDISTVKIPKQDSNTFLNETNLPKACENDIEIVQIEGQNDFECESQNNKVEESECGSIPSIEFGNDETKSTKCTDEIDDQEEKDIDESIMKEVQQIQNRSDSSMSSEIMRDDVELFDSIVRKATVEKQVLQSFKNFDRGDLASDDVKIGTNVPEVKTTESMECILGLKPNEIQPEVIGQYSGTFVEGNPSEPSCREPLEGLSQNAPPEKLEFKNQTSELQYIPSLNPVGNQPMKLTDLAYATISAYDKNCLDIASSDQVKMMDNEHNKLSLNNSIPQLTNEIKTRECFAPTDVSSMYNSNMGTADLSESPGGMDSLLTSFQSISGSMIPDSLSLFSSSDSNLQFSQTSQIQNEDILPISLPPETFRLSLPQSTPLRPTENSQADSQMFNMSDELLNIFCNREFLRIWSNFNDVGCEVTVDNSNVEDIASELTQEQIDFIPNYIAEEEFDSNAPTDPMVGGQKELVSDPKQESQLDEAPLPESVLSFDEEIMHSYAYYTNCEVNSSKQSTTNELNNINISDIQSGHDISAQKQNLDNSLLIQQDMSNFVNSTPLQIENASVLLTTQDFGSTAAISANASEKFDSGNPITISPSKPELVEMVDSINEKMNKKCYTNSNTSSPNTSPDSTKSSNEKSVRNPVKVQKIPASKYAPPKKPRNNDSNQTKKPQEKKVRPNKQIEKEDNSVTSSLSIESNNSWDMPQLLSPPEHSSWRKKSAPTSQKSEPQTSQIEVPQVDKTPEKLAEDDTVQFTKYNMYDRMKAMKRNAARGPKLYNYDEDSSSSNKSKKRKLTNKSELTSDKQEPSAHSKQELSALSKQTVSAHSKHELGTLSKQELSALSKQAVSVHSKHELGALSKQELGALSKQAVSAHSKHDTGVLSKQEVSTHSKQEESEHLKQEIIALSKQEMSSLSKQELGSLSKQELSALSKQAVSAHSKHELSAHSKQELSALSKQAASAHSKHELGALSKQELGALSKQAVSARSKHDTGALSKQEVITHPKQEESEHLKQEIIALSKQEMSTLSKQELGARSKQELSAHPKHLIAHSVSPNLKEKSSEKREAYNDYKTNSKKMRVAEPSVREFRKSELYKSESSNLDSSEARNLDSEFDKLKNSNPPSKSSFSKNMRYSRTDRIMSNAQDLGGYRHGVQHGYSERAKQEEQRRYPESNRKIDEECRRKPEEDCRRQLRRSGSSHSRSSPYTSDDHRRESRRRSAQSEMKKSDARHGRESRKQQESSEDRRRQERNNPKYPQSKSERSLRGDGSSEYQPHSSQSQQKSDKQWLKLIDEQFPLDKKVFDNISGQ